MGYEEAQKSYELIKFHPLLNKIYSVEYLEELKAQLKAHTWKQIHAEHYRASLEVMIASRSFSDTMLREFEFFPDKDLQESTEFASSKKLNNMKNMGLYVDAFKNPFWTPSAMTNTSVEFAQKLLTTKLDEVKEIVKFFSNLDMIPKRNLDSAIQQMTQLIGVLQDAESDGIKEFEEFDFDFLLPSQEFL